MSEYVYNQGNLSNPGTEKIVREHVYQYIGNREWKTFLGSLLESIPGVKCVIVCGSNKWQLLLWGILKLYVSCLCVFCFFKWE